MSCSTRVRGYRKMAVRLTSYFQGGLKLLRSAGALVLQA